MAQNFIPEDRVKIVWDESREGIIYLRRGVPELDLGENVKWANARIRVADENHYVKGMCMYSDLMPDGCDVIVFRAKFRSIGSDLFDTDFEGVLKKGIMPSICYADCSKTKAKHRHEIVVDDKTWKKIQKELHRKGSKDGK